MMAKSGMQGTSNHGDQEVSPGLGQSAASEQDGRFVDMSVLLRQVFQLHQTALEGSLTQYRTLKSKYSKLNRERNTVYDHGKQYQEKHDVLLEENRSLREEAKQLKDRLLEPCRQCELFQKQLAQQEEIYRRAYSLLLQEKDNTIARLERRIQMLEDPSRSSQARVRNSQKVGTKSQQKSQKANHQDIEFVISQAIAMATQEVMCEDPYSEIEPEIKGKSSQAVQQSKTENSQAQAQPEKGKQRRSKDAESSSTSIHRGQSKVYPTEQKPHLEKSKDGGPQNLPSRTERETHEEPVHRDNHVPINEKLNTSGGKISSEEESPGSSRSRGLKLTTKTSKRTRCRYIEDKLPESKKARISDRDREAPSVSLAQTSRQSTQGKLQDSVLQVLVQDTCDPHSQVAKAASGLPLASSTQIPWQQERKTPSESHARKKMHIEIPDITVPETVPFDGLDLDEYEDEKSSPGNTVDTVRQIKIGTPHSRMPNRSADGSTAELLSSAVSGVYGHHGDEDETRIDFPEETLGRNGAVSRSKHNMSNVSRLDEEGSGSTELGDKSNIKSSSPQSPVFEGNRDRVMREDSRAKHTRSPSLFDEDSGDHSDSSDHMNEAEFAANILSKTGRSPSGPQRKVKTRGKLCARENTRDSKLSNLNLSVASNPSPSVLSGKVLRQAIREDEGSPFHAKPKSKSGAHGFNIKSCDMIQNETIPKTGRNTRSQTVRLSQEPLQLELNLTDGDRVRKQEKPGKKFVQTTLSPSHFQPKRTVLNKIPEFNGGRLRSSQTKEERELMDIEEATKRSLADFGVTSQQGGLDLVLSDLTTIVDPRMTSTPHGNRVKHRREVSESCSPFKKPHIPYKSSYTPEKISHRHDIDERLRRSPRLKQSRDHIPEPTDPATSQGQRSQAISSNLSNGECDETKGISDMYPATVPADLNGSLDPNIRLSEYDTTLHAGTLGQSQIPGTDLEPYLEDVEPLEAISFLDMEMEGKETQLQRSQRSKSQVKKKLMKYDEESEDIELSRTSVVFGPTKISSLEKTRSQKQLKARKPGGKVHGSEQDIFSSQAFLDSDVKSGSKTARPITMGASHEDSFDRVPRKASPGYAYVDVVRKQSERRQLQAYVCQECDRYFTSKGLTGEEKAEAMKACRHRARYVPPGTPEHYWSIGFPDTQECEERGYLNKTQAKPSKSRRRKPYTKLFRSEKEDPNNEHEGDEDEMDVSD